MGSGQRYSDDWTSAPGPGAGSNASHLFLVVARTGSFQAMYSVTARSFSMSSRGLTSSQYAPAGWGAVGGMSTEMKSPSGSIAAGRLHPHLDAAGPVHPELLRRVPLPFGNADGQFWLEEERDLQGFLLTGDSEVRWT